eukprot:13853567-Alexandrium_andersonii.AAC.1
MSASLVGSEMCIRDSLGHDRGCRARVDGYLDLGVALELRPQRTAALTTVSYTHLTLPTICSV